MPTKDLLIQEAARYIARSQGHLLNENKDDPSYHISVHQDLMHLAGGERGYSNGAADYYNAAKTSNEIENLYNSTIEPILQKHGYPNRQTPEMHNAQQEILKMWREVK